MNKIMCCNCVDGMSSIDAESVNLTVTSPPFGKLRTYKGYVFDHEAVLQGLFRITKPGGIVVWVVTSKKK